MSATLISEHAHAHTNGSAKPVRHDPSGVLSRLLQSNAQWSSDVARVEPGFFEQCAKGQAPKVSLASAAVMPEESARRSERVYFTSRTGWKQLWRVDELAICV